MKVINGRPDLAWPIFARVHNPLRAAVMASRACQLHVSEDISETEIWTGFAKAYEEWAVGVLSHVKRPAMAMQMLTLIPITEETSEPLWPHSVMDESVNAHTAPPCRTL